MDTDVLSISTDKHPWMKKLLMNRTRGPVALLKRNQSKKLPIMSRLHFSLLEKSG
jgi:hypothetical protein